MNVTSSNSFRVLTTLIACSLAVGLLNAGDLAAKDPGCEVAKLVSTGGPAPRNPRTLAIRWTGYSNFELAYNGQVLLLDAYFDRGSTYPPLGFKAADIRRADAILIGHRHFDHMSDAAIVAIKTGAAVAGASLTTDKLKTQNVEARQIRTVTGRGGESLTFGSFVVEPILARHGEPEPDVTSAFNQALRSVTRPYTPAQQAESAIIRSRGTSDPRITAEGTIAYLITLDDGFRIMYRDSGGEITDYERAAMQRTGRVDVALAATAADFLPSLTTLRALTYLRVYKPRVYMPAHHDSDFNGLWRPTEPIFQALKEEQPDLITVSRQYREPACFDTRDDIRHRQAK